MHWLRAIAFAAGDSDQNRMELLEPIVQVRSGAMGWIKDKLAGILYPPGTTRLEFKVSCALVLILFSTQLTLTTPFSYLPSMVKSFGYSDKDAGYYAGIVASSLFVGRFIGGYFWGYCTDKFGRRPVLLISASLTYFATLLFGFSTNLYFAIFARFLQGLFNGVIVCGRAAFAEICDDTNQAIGVSLIFASWNSAIVLGPALGGFLATPFKKYPKVFGHGHIGRFLKQFPYILPSVTVSVFLLMSIIAVFFFFEETLSSKAKEAKLHGSDDELTDTATLLGSDKDGIEDDDDDDTIYEQKMKLKDTEAKGNLQTKGEIITAERRSRCNSKCLCCGVVMRSIKSTSLYSLMSDRLVSLCVGVFGMSGFVIIGFQELTSLWMATGLRLGGLGFTTNLIGVALLWPALGSVVLQPLIFGRVERSIGGIRTSQLFLVFLALMTAGFPFLNKTSRNENALWGLLISMLLVRMISDISVRSAFAMFVNNCVYSEKAGLVNGYAFSVQEIMRVFSPSLLGALYAWSMKHGRKIGFPMTHHLPFFILTFMILLELLLTFLLPKSINLPKKRQPSKEENTQS